ncbi:MAG: Succinoglycan biosynthesis protein exoA [Labilithrix sp.]|nr:Succinoglycan biosynthesis protein exoA [Labilithrix sp.]
MTDALDLPLVTLAIPCFNEERHIAACIDDVFAQDYPADRMEVLIGDGMSTDRTREILAEICARHGGRIRVIDNPRRLQAAAMNAMIADAKGDIIVRMDVHARYARDFVRQCVSVLEETGAQNVGGAARPLSESWFQRAVCAALGSRLAVGGSAYRNPDTEGFADTVFPGAFPRRVFDVVGSFDANAITNEDAEINQRILKAGGRIYVSRKIVVHYFPRDSFSGLARQYFKYGKGRARTLLKHRGLPTLRPMVPFFMVAGGLGLLATAHLQPLTPFVFGLYGIANLYEAVRVTRGEGLAMVPVVASIFPVLHVAHGVGFAVGLVHYALSPDWSREPETSTGSFATSSPTRANATARA